MKKIVLLMAGVLAVALSGSAQAATMFAVQDSAGTDKFTVSDQGVLNQVVTTGYIGTGVATPAVAFHAEGASGVGVAMRLLATSGTGASAGGGYSAGFNRAGLTLPQAGDRLGYYYFSMQDTNAAGVFGVAHTAGIAAYAEENFVTAFGGAGKRGTYFAFETAPANTAGNTTRAERFRVDTKGAMVTGTLRFASSVAPANNDTCTAGEFRVTATGLYVCVAANSWQKASLAAY